jgi:hypothetical protein
MFRVYTLGPNAFQLMISIVSENSYSMLTIYSTFLLLPVTMLFIMLPMYAAA